jgi:hypothetical protein
MNKEKDQVIEIIRQLPDESTVDDIMEELYFRMQVDRGIKELDEEKGIPHQDVRDRLSRDGSKNNMVSSCRPKLTRNLLIYRT